jgi:hypothetical protein
MAEISPHILNKSPWASTSVYKGSVNRLKDKHITSFQKWPNIQKRKFKRKTDRMPFLITYTAWNVYFGRKRTRKMKIMVNSKGGKEKRRAKITDQVNVVMKKTNKNRGTYFNCTKMVKLIDIESVLILQQIFQ